MSNAVCDCLVCPCAVPVHRLGARCVACEGGRHCDPVTGARLGKGNRRAARTPAQVAHRALHPPLLAKRPRLLLPDPRSPRR